MTRTHQDPQALIVQTNAPQNVSQPVASLQFPIRDVVAEALRVFATNPLGFEPKGPFWREIGALPSVASRDGILRTCLNAGLLLPPGEMFGAPCGYIPGPAAFACGLHFPPISGLSTRPSAEEITHHARTRVLSRFIKLLTEEATPSPSKVAIFLNLPAIAGAQVLTSLESEGLITNTESGLIPTEKMEYLIGEPGLVQRMTANTANGASPHRSVYKTKRAEAEQVFQSIKEPLLSLVAGHPGRTAHELFAIVTEIDGWLPAGTTKPMFIRWLDKITEESLLSLTRQRQGPVRIIQLYYAAPNSPSDPDGGHAQSA